MSTESDLVDALEADAAVAARFGDRIYPDRMPDNPTLPCIVYQRISTVPDVDLDAVTNTAARFQIDVWAKTRLETVDGAAEIHAALNYTAPGTAIDRILPDGWRDLYDDTAQLYRRSLDFLVFETL